MDDVVPVETSSRKPVRVRFVLKGNKKQKLCTDHHNDHDKPIEAKSRSDDKLVLLLPSESREERADKQPINTLPVNDSTIKVRQLDEQVMISNSSIESGRPKKRKIKTEVEPKSHFLRDRKNKINYSEINNNGFDECSTRVSRPKFSVSLTKKEIEEDFYSMIPKFSVSLTKKEIEEDINSMTMTKLRNRRPKIKRPKYIQNKMDALFPGSTLAKITANRYKVDK